MFSWKELGLVRCIGLRFETPGQARILASFDEHYAATVQRGDAVLLVVRGTEAEMRRAVTPASRPTGPIQLSQDEAICRSRPTCGQPRHPDCLQEPGTMPRLAELRVNGQDGHAHCCSRPRARADRSSGCRLSWLCQFGGDSSLNGCFAFSTPNRQLRRRLNPLRFRAPALALCAPGGRRKELRPFAYRTISVYYLAMDLMTCCRLCTL